MALWNSHSKPIFIVFDVSNLHARFIIIILLVVWLIYTVKNNIFLDT